MAARLTIAIPTFNRAHLLRRALESALAQTSDEIEILVSDNGSTDRTPDVIADYADGRLRRIRHERTVTRAQHGTLIFSAVTTEFIVILSDDDFLEPDFSAEVLRLFDEHPELSFAYTGCIEHYDDQSLTAHAGPRVESSLEFLAAHYAGLRQVSWCACVTRIADLRRLSPQPDERIIGDMYFWTQIAFQGPVGCVSRPLSHYTVLLPGGDNESRTTPIAAWSRDVKLLADNVLLGVSKAGASEDFRASLRAQMGRYLTRSIANQYMWARIYGMRRLECLGVVPSSLKYEGWHLAAILRIAASLILPRRLLRKVVIAGVRRIAAARR